MYGLAKDERVDFTEMKFSQQKLVLKLPLERSMINQRCQQIIKFSISTNLEKKKRCPKMTTSPLLHLPAVE